MADPYDFDPDDTVATPAKAPPLFEVGPRPPFDWIAAVSPLRCKGSGSLPYGMNPEGLDLSPGQRAPCRGCFDCREPGSNCAHVSQCPPGQCSISDGPRTDRVA